MVDLTNLRSRTPSRDGLLPAPAQAPAPRRRASSVPATNFRRPEWMERVSLTPLRHKRTASQAASQPVQPSTSTRVLRPRPSRSTLSQPPNSPRPSPAPHARTPKPKPPASQPTRKRTRASSPTVMPIQSLSQRTETAADVERGSRLLTPAPSSSFPDKSRPKTPTRGSKTSRTPRLAAAARKDKGKGKAISREPSLAPVVDDARSVASPSTGRPAKRRRLSPSRIPTEDASADDMDGADLDRDFCMMALPEVAALPWTPGAAADVSQTSLYVPPGVGHLIASMQHALVAQCRARENAEERCVEELRKRVEAERAAAALAEDNRRLEAEIRAWWDAAAAALSETFSTSLGAAPPKATKPNHVEAEKTKDLLVNLSRLSADGKPYTTLQRAAAVQEFFKRLLPLPAQDAPDEHLTVSS
ncbi:hypothetical protein B0H21DRAFT_383358 [Amylocystis lapponica]|nr:hypothetical protein B0H21DRAFT_383358 [Amylocystis lapponica]